MATETLSVSRMTCFLSCPRKHFYAYELGLEKDEAAPALRFGTAMHKVMEYRAEGADAGEAFEKCKSGGTLADPLELATLYGLTKGYYGHYADTAEVIEKMYPEVAFNLPIPHSRTFASVGIIDGLAILKDGRTALVEHKTTGEDISPTAEYWTRLHFNPQLYAYVLAARANGWNVDAVIYDVIRKPSIRQRKDETPEAFGERLAADCAERPDFYFARREVPILHTAIAEYEVMRHTVCQMLLHCKLAARRAELPEHAWARNCNGLTCRTCDFAGFCLGGVHVTPTTVPAGFHFKRPAASAAGVTKTENTEVTERN